MKAYAYAVIGLYAAALAAGILMMNAIVVTATTIMLTISIVAYKGWYIIEPVIFRHTNLVQTLDGCEIDKERKTAIRRIDGKYVSTAAALLDTTMITELDREKLENIIKNTNSAFKLVLWVKQLELDKLIDDMRTRKYYKEAQLSRMIRENRAYNKTRMEALSNAVKQIDHDILEISSGKVPLRIAYYIVVSSVSENRFNAENDALFKLKNVAAAFDAALNSKSRIVFGDELVGALRFDSVMVA